MDFGEIGRFQRSQNYWQLAKKLKKRKEKENPSRLNTRQASLKYSETWISIIIIMFIDWISLPAV